MGFLKNFTSRAKSAPTFIPTPEQEAIYRAGAAMAPGDVLMLKARAGCAKTTTMTSMLPKMYTPGDTGIVLTFSKANREELVMKVPSWCKASTFHSLAKRNTQARLSFGKVWDLLKGPARSGGVRDRKLRAPVKNLVGLGKNLGIGLPGEQPDVLEFWVSMIATYGIKHKRTTSPEEVAFQAQRLFQKSLAVEAEGDFDDMLYWLARDGFAAGTPRYSIVAIDEYQDTNPTQSAIVDRIIEHAEGNCRIIAPGDPAQAIYGWRGAGVNSFDDGVRRYDAKVMTLTVSQRCPRAVIAEAQEWVPDIRAKDGAPDGFVGQVALDDFSIDCVGDGHVVLCRNNAPLLALALEALRKDRKVAIQGRDILDKTLGLFRTLFNWGRTRHDTDRAFVDRRFQLQEELSDQPFALGKAIEDLDTAKAVWEILQERSQDSGIWADFGKFLAYAQDTMEALFFNPAPGKTPEGITLSTIHRAKGLEWEVVWFYQPKLIPSKAAKALGGWHLRQEDNLRYVAITRAKDSLVYVG